MNVGEKIAAYLRAHANPKTGRPMSPTAFAKVAATSRQNINNLLGGTVETPRSGLKGIARALGMTVDELLDPAAAWTSSNGDACAASSPAHPTNTPATSGFPQRIQILLTETNITTATLARGLQLPHATVKRWLSGEEQPTAEQVFAIADAHGFSARWLATSEWEVTGTDVTVPLRIRVEKEELDLLTMFQQLQPQLQAKVIGYVEGLVDAAKPAENVVVMRQSSKKRER